MNTILIVDDVHEILLERLEAQGLRCDYQPKISKEEALAVLPEYEGLVIRSKFLLSREILESAARLRFIARAGAGMDNIDTDTADQLKISCLNAPEGNRDAVGEHAMGLLLSLSNKLQQGNREVRNQVWDRSGNRGIELKGKTVAIIGYGFMGSSFASKLSGFETNVIAFDKYKTGFGSGLVEEVGLEALFERADVLSLHLPLTGESKEMINRDFISRFHKPFFLLNTSRGEIVKTADLIWGLEQKKISGAGLDVLEHEKFPLSGSNLEQFEELRRFDSVLFSPHVAGWSVESYIRISEVLAEKILNFYAESSK